MIPLPGSSAACGYFNWPAQRVSRSPVGHSIHAHSFSLCPLPGRKAVWRYLTWPACQVCGPSVGLSIHAHSFSLSSLRWGGQVPCPAPRLGASISPGLLAEFAGPCLPLYPCTQFYSLLPEVGGPCPAARLACPLNPQASCLLLYPLTQYFSLVHEVGG